VPKLPHGLTARWQGPAIIFIIVVLLFGNSVRFGFLEHDDDRHIGGNPRMLALSTEALKSYWAAPYLGLYIPVTYSYWSGVTALSYALDLDAQVPTIKPWLFHLGNVLLHAANGIIVFLLLEGFGVGAVAALIASLFFVAHPIQVEAVAWASGAKDVLSGFLGLSSLLFYAHFMRHLVRPRTNKNSDYKRTITYYMIAYMLFCLAILAKPAEVILPPLFLLMALYYDGRPRWRSLLLCIPHLITVVVYLKIASVTQATEGPFPPVPLWARPLIAADAWLFYLQKVLIPFGFALDYGRRPDLVLQDTPLLLRATLPFVIGGAMLWQWRRRPTPTLKLLCILLAAFAFALLPTLGLLQFAYQFFSIVCDRYAYLAMLAPAIGVAAVCGKFTAHRYRNLVVGMVLTILTWQTLQLVQSWSNERTLFSHSLESEPNGAVALVGLSNDTANSGNWRGTVPLLRRAQEALPEWARPHNNMGTTHMNLGDPAAAAGEYAAAIRLYPAYALAHCNRCAALTDLRRLDEAIAACREALRLSPEYQQAFTNLGAALAAAKRLPEAVENFEKASALAPTAFGPRHRWAISLQEAGRWTESLEQLNILRRQYPANLRLVLDLGNSLVVLGRTAEAKQLYATYAQLTPDAVAKAQVTAVLQSLNESGTSPPGSGVPAPRAP